LSQRELAEPGISYAYLSRIEAGQRAPSLKALRIVAKKLGVSAEHLETGEPIPALARLEPQASDAELALRLGADLERADALFADVLAEADEADEPALAARSAAGLGLLAAHRSANAEAIRYLEAATRSGYLPPQARPTCTTRSERRTWPMTRRRSPSRFGSVCSNNSAPRTRRTWPC
jgi:transcriptional regulator with XRE-family HTH domain